ncbi:MAG: hypothetical protein K9H64_11035 [Bacteroidales bacterium]|nr:hypothetical protein [Bacteroidales bacterium]MCF8456484.1 hypothetical protein [Bacteroidales bacterium]
MEHLGGVFTPPLFTIDGDMVYLRLEWVVGNASQIGFWLIVIVSLLITSSTTLSMSSITTNIRIGARETYAMPT